MSNLRVAQEAHDFREVLDKQMFQATFLLVVLVASGDKTASLTPAEIFQKNKNIPDLKEQLDPPKTTPGYPPTILIFVPGIPEGVWLQKKFEESLGYVYADEEDLSQHVTFVQFNKKTQKYLKPSDINMTKNASKDIWHVRYQMRKNFSTCVK